MKFKQDILIFLDAGPVSHGDFYPAKLPPKLQFPERQLQQSLHYNAKLHPIVFRPLAQFEDRAGVVTKV